MLVRKFVSLGLFALILATPAAYAGSIVFSFNGASSAADWSWADGASSVDARAYSASVGPIGGISIPLNGNVQVTFISGPETGGSGTLDNPYNFGRGGDIVVTGCLPGQGSGCTTLYLFRGEFEAEMGFAGPGDLVFDAPYMSGTINPAIAALFGISNENVLGSFDAVLSCAAATDGCKTGFDGLVGSADMVLIAGSCGDNSPAGSCSPSVPEPASLALTTLGLLVLLIMTARWRLARS